MKSTVLTTVLLASASVFAGPRMDGKLDDPQWSKAQKFTKFYLNNTKKPAPPAEALVIHDDDAVYVGFRVPFNKGKKPVANITQRDGCVNHDDSVEVMVAPGSQRDRYAHVVVNSIGTVYDGYADQGGHVTDGKWNGAIKAKSYVGEDFWSTEIRIPYSTLEMDGVKSPVWGFNFCCNFAGGIWASAAENGVFHVAQSFLEVGGFDLDYSRYTLRITPPSSEIRQDTDGNYLVNVKSDIINTVAKPVKAKLDLTLAGDDVDSKARTITVKPSASESVDFPMLKVKQPGKYDLIISILDPVTRRVNVRRKYPVSIEYNPLSVALDTPWYHGNIFATQKLEKVIWDVKCSAPAGTITTGIADASGNVLFKKSLTAGGKVEYPVSSLADGKYTVFAEAGKYRVATPLRKLPYLKGEVWRDRKGFWTIEGKRIFLLMEWNDVNTPGTLISTNPKDGRKKLGFETMFSSFKGKKGLCQPVFPKECADAYRKVIRADKNSENLFARYFMDEPEISGCTVTGTQGAAEVIRDEDPYHPLVVSNDSTAGLHDFAACTDINGLHPYPSPEKGKVRPGFAKIVTFMDEAMSGNRTGKNFQTVAYLQQGFNYGDYGAISRVPTFDEIRTQFWMTVILGGRGIMFYNRNTKHYPELRIGTPEIGREFAALCDVLVEDDDPRGITSGKFRTLVKKHNGQLWVFAMSAQKEPFTQEINFPEFGNRKLQVWREGRTIQAENGTIKDSFSNYDVHIYTTDTDTKGFRSCAEVEKEIAEANAARRKPGNILFQNQEYDKLNFRASSNQWTYRRADTTLWHITDGINLGDIATQEYGLRMSYFMDKTPNKLPDWIEILLPKPETVGRIVVYPAVRSLKDYQVQIRKNGEWKTVGSVTDAQGESQEFTFAPESTDAIRIYVTANRGKYTMIQEVEAYAK